ncbi:LOW QUALITY PROTEIN: uncharacterized protein LOC114014522 [Falco cherrug]|uniref:LOW QUALITY PROTEIN: uncharacterized protein LOC114014522 n=1 Tax=Falco cherrug TaxID=345164 RepID=UPI002478A323|nr:LOW QUALITY PROTEIN: uncharacterized protein LOC114014522 [Falco cherrug]
MFSYFKDGAESPPGHPGACCLGTGETHHGLTRQWAQLLGCAAAARASCCSQPPPLSADDQNFLANTNCTILWLLSYPRRMVEVLDTSEPWLQGCSSPPPSLGSSTGALSHLRWDATQAPCDMDAVVRWGVLSLPCWQPTPLLPGFSRCHLPTPEVLFQVTSLGKKASGFLQARATYCVCRVAFGVPGRCSGKWSPQPLGVLPVHGVVGQDCALLSPQPLSLPPQPPACCLAVPRKVSGRGSGRVGTEGTRPKVASPSRARPVLGRWGRRC